MSVTPVAMPCRFAALQASACVTKMRRIIRAAARRAPPDHEAMSEFASVCSIDRHLLHTRNKCTIALC